MEIWEIAIGVWLGMVIFGFCRAVTIALWDKLHPGLCARHDCLRCINIKLHRRGFPDE